MARDKKVRVSDRELDLIRRVRGEEFGTESVPFGEVIEVACESYLEK